MEKPNVVSSLKAYLVEEVLEGDASEFDETTPLLELGLLDSFSIVGILSFIESEFGIEIPLETLAIERLKDVNTLADLVIESNRSQ